MLYIRISSSELLRRTRRVAGEYEHRLVGRIGKSAGQQQLTSLGRRPRPAEMVVTELGPPLEVVVDEVVEENPVHDHKSASAPGGVETSPQIQWLA